MALTFKAAQSLLRAYNMTIRKVENEYRVNFKGGKEETAAYETDLQAAIDTAIAMYAHSIKHSIKLNILKQG